jgi:putative nucleotidyltransferase with HDIG domain
MSTPLRLLLVEDNEDDAQLILHELKRNGYEVEFERVETAESMQSALARQDWDVILSDYSLPKFGAPQALDLMQTSGYDLPFIIISGTIGDETAVQSLKAGAHDFLIKGNLLRLVPAIERERRDAKIRREHRQREREVEAIASISMALRKASTLDEMLPRLLDRTLELINAEMGSIWLYDTSTDRINLAAQRGWNGRDPNTSLRPGQGIPGLVVRTGQSIVTREIHSDPRVFKENLENIPRGIGGACIPLYSDENVVGVLFVNVKVPREISAGELRVLNALAEIGGNAIHRMRLLEQTLKQVERLRSLRTIDIAISGSLDLQVSLKTVLEEAITQLKVDAACVLLINPETRRLEFFAGQGFRTKNINSTSLSLGEGHAGQAAFDKKIVYVKDLNKSDQVFVRAELLKEDEFVAYFGMPLIAKGEVEGVLEIFNRSPLHVNMEWLSFMDSLSWQAAIAVDNALLFENLQRSNLDLESAYTATIEGWSHALDLRDKETEGHSLRVTEITLKLARTIGMDEALLVNVKRGALLHDIGKMGVPDSILLKPGPLTEDEWLIMRQHPQFAYDLLSPITYLQEALDIPYSHHEKWDGTGYPRKLKGEEISLAARIFAVVDVWDALTNERPYRLAWPESKAFEYIRENSGIYFDPQVVEIFLRNITDTKP